MKKDNKGISLPLAMGLVMIMTLLAFAILEYIIPFSREIKGIENSSNAYYQANSGIEEALYYVYTRNNSGDLDDRDEDSKNYVGNTITNKYNTSSSGNILPPPGEGNSEYDDKWNTISSGNPIQLSVGKNMIDPTDLKIIFRMPSLYTSMTLSGSLFSPYLQIVNWQLSGTNDTLNASGSIIRANTIDNENITDFSLLEGSNLSGNESFFSTFYGLNCTGTNSGCVLKFSVINKLETDDGLDSILIPFLEWQLDVGTSVIPLRYTKIESSGKSYGYRKDLEVKVAGNTVNEAFDFTVFQ